MTRSFVRRNGCGFWTPDSLLEVWMYEMSLPLKESVDETERQYGELLQGQATAGMHGCISLEFDEMSEALRQAVQEHTVKLVARVKAEPHRLEKTRLNRLRLGGGTEYLRDVALLYFLALSEQILRVLRNECTWTPGDPGAVDWWPDREG
jgi:hypothetical protein